MCKGDTIMPSPNLKMIIELNTGDAVLVKEENIPHMNRRKRKIVDVVYGNNGLVKGVELLI